MVWLDIINVHEVINFQEEQTKNNETSRATSQHNSRLHYVLSKENLRLNPKSCMTHDMTCETSTLEKGRLTKWYNVTFSLF